MTREEFKTETNIILNDDWDFDYGADDVVHIIYKIWCKECGHEFDTCDYDEHMIEEMQYCPFCGRKIKMMEWY